MSDTVEPQTPIPTLLRSGNPSGLIIPVLMTFDSGSELTVHTPTGNNRVALVGLSIVEATAFSLIISDDDGQITGWEFADDVKFIIPIGRPILMTRPGKALKFDSSSSSSQILAHVMELTHLDLLNL